MNTHTHIYIYIYITSKCAWLHSLIKNKICWTKPSGPFFAKVTCIQMPGNAKDRWTLTLNQFQVNSFLVLSFSKSKLLGTWSFIFMEKPNPNRKKKLLPQDVLLRKVFDLGVLLWLLGSKLVARKQQKPHLRPAKWSFTWDDPHQTPAGNVLARPAGSHDQYTSGYISVWTALWVFDVWCVTGWWYTYPSEKYEIQLGLWHSQYMEQYKMFQTTNQVTMCHYVRLCVTLCDCLSSLPSSMVFNQFWEMCGLLLYCLQLMKIKVAIFRIPLDYNKDIQTWVFNHAYACSSLIPVQICCVSNPLLRPRLPRSLSLYNWEIHLTLPTVMCGTWYIVYMLGSYHLVCRLNKIKLQTTYIIHLYDLHILFDVNARHKRPHSSQLCNLSRNAVLSLCSKLVSTSHVHQAIYIYNVYY